MITFGDMENEKYFYGYYNEIEYNHVYVILEYSYIYISMYIYCLESIILQNSFCKSKRKIKLIHTIIKIILQNCINTNIGIIILLYVFEYM